MKIQYHYSGEKIIISVKIKISNRIHNRNPNLNPAEERVI
jgi:hypothetical protein